MNKKPKFSIFAAAKNKFVAMRKKWGIKPSHTMAEVSQMAGLPVEYLESCPANFEGFLDCHDEPRFIAVNPNLPAHEKALFIARQIALCAHQRRYNSVAIDCAWKWEMFDAAPAKLKQKISDMDVEYRAHWLMLFWSTGDEFRAFMRANPKRFWSHIFTDNIVWYHLSVFRTKLWFAKTYRKINFARFPTT